ncbi:MAG: hypothetical protein ABIV51_14060 [Saprospiraceae bacterium]
MSFENIRLPIIGAALLIGLLLYSNACTMEQVPEPQVCFERDVQPILIANCTGSGCHNPIDHESGRDYTTYGGLLGDIQAGNYRKSKLYLVMVQPGGAIMPPKPNDRLTTDQVRIIATWIEQGAINDTCAPTNCDTSGIMSYTLHIQPILQTNCVGGGCHSGTQPASGISYTSYSSTNLTVTNGTLLGSIQHQGGFQPMPKGGNLLPACSVAKIKKWIDNGALNN